MKYRAEKLAGAVRICCIAAGKIVLTSLTCPQHIGYDMMIAKTCHTYGSKVFKYLKIHKNFYPQKISRLTVCICALTPYDKLVSFSCKKVWILQIDIDLSCLSVGPLVDWIMYYSVTFRQGLCTTVIEIVIVVLS